MDFTHGTRNGRKFMREEDRKFSSNMSPSSKISGKDKQIMYQRVENHPVSIVDIPPSKHMKDKTSVSKEIYQDESLNELKSNKTPTKCTPQDCFTNEILSPVLGSAMTFHKSSRPKSFLSSTPTSISVKPATPEPKVSVLNILDQLCSPVPIEETEPMQYESSRHGSKKIFTVDYDEKKTVNKNVDFFSNAPDKLKRNDTLGKFSKKTCVSNVVVNHDDLFDDISDISLQVLCEATSDLVNNSKPDASTNTNLKNSSVHNIFYEYGDSASDSKEEPVKNQPAKESVKCTSNEKSESINNFHYRNLVYSDINFNMDATTSVRLDDLLSEAKFLEEANRFYIKGFKCKDLHKPSKTLHDNPTKSLDLLNKNETESKSMLQVQIQHEMGNKGLNDSFGISDSQFFEAIEAVEFISNLDTTTDKNFDTSEKITNEHNFLANLKNELREPSQIESKSNERNSFCKGNPSQTSSSFDLSGKNKTATQLTNSTNTKNEILLPTLSTEDIKLSTNGTDINNFLILKDHPFKKPANPINKANNLINGVRCKSNPVHKDNENQSGMSAENPDERCARDINLSTDGSNDSKSLFKDFHTDNEKNDKSFNRTVEKAKLFGNGSYEKNSIKKGFQTASGKSVKITEESLTKAKMLLHDSYLLGEPKEPSSKLDNTSETTLVRNINLLDFKRFEGNSLMINLVNTSDNLWSLSDELLCQSSSAVTDRTLETDHILKGFQMQNLETFSSNKMSEKTFEESNPVIGEIDSILKGFQRAKRKKVKMLGNSKENTEKLHNDKELCKNNVDVSAETMNKENEKHVIESLQQIKQLFDESSHVMPRGFQTASGKSVEISEKSLQQAKQLFDESSNLMSTGFQSACRKPAKICEESHQHAKKLLDESSHVMSRGFQTASEKYIEISKESQEQTKQLFDESSHVMPRGFQTASGKSVEISEKSLQQAKQLFDESSNLMSTGFQSACRKPAKICEESHQHAKKLLDESSHVMSRGFQTASEKSIEISKESHEQTKLLFDESFDVMPKGFQTAIGKCVDISEESLQLAKQLFNESSYVMPRGFQTASGKSVKISEESLQQAKQLFDKSTHVMPRGFHTASGKSVEISEESLQQVKQLFDESTDVRRRGFQTASGKSVEISEESLQHAKQLFDESSHVMPRGFQTASGKSVEISKESLQQAQQLFDEGSFVMPRGFQTASRKSVEISKESLQQAKQLFDQSSCVLPRGFQTASGKSVDISEESLQQAKQLFDESTHVMPRGFQTASGKSVEITKESLQQAKELFGQSSCVIPRGFQTASGKSVEISEESLHQAKQLFDESSFVMPRGFQTASGKSVEITEESLQQAKELFDQSSCVLPRGFQTASGKSVEISEESLQQDKQLLDESSNLVPKGSQTARGKSVTISEESLQHAKHLFDDNSIVLQKGFQTASEKSVESPEESIHEAKHIFNDNFNLRKCLADEQSLKYCNESDYSEVGRKFTDVTPNMKTKQLGGVLSSESCQKQINSSVSSQVHQKKIFSLNNRPLIAYNSQTKEMLNYQEILKRKRRNISLPDLASETDEKLDRVSDQIKNYNSLMKRRKLFPETDVTNNCNNVGEVLYNEENSILFAGASVISEADLSLLNHSRNSLSGNETQAEEPCSPGVMSPSIAQEVSESMAALMADEASSSPFSLKPCISTPGMLYDRQVGLLSLNCFENEVQINNKQLSPILDSHCKIKKRHGKLNTSTTAISTPISHFSKTSNSISNFSNLKPSYSTSTPNESHFQSKRKSLYSNFHAKPEKRKKIYLSPEKEVENNIAKAKLQAAHRQEESIKEKLKNHTCIKPCSGLYLLKKQTEKSTSLKDLTENGCLRFFAADKLHDLQIKKSILETTRKSATDFKFNALDYYSEEISITNVNGVPVGDGALLIFDAEGKAGVKEITRAFLASPSIDPSLVSSDWVENHFQWIILKMAATERMFPHKLGNRYLTPHNVMLQLKYRYDREIDGNQRPALRKILEKDESPGRTMVLFVADIVDAVPLPDKEDAGRRQELELSDGWYSVRAAVDYEMELLIRNGRVGIGTKLMICGAELVNNDAGCHPLQAPAGVRLRVATNSCRRARWFARLGFHGRSPRPARLRDVRGRGGALPSLTALVARTYPTLFLEKVDGKTGRVQGQGSKGQLSTPVVTPSVLKPAATTELLSKMIRSERAEQTAADEHETRRQRCAEVILSQLQREQESARVQTTRLTRTTVGRAASTRQLCALLEGADDTGFLQDVLSKDQLNEIRQLKEEEMRKVQQELQEKLVKELDKKVAPRHVTRMLKVRLMDEGQETDRSALLTMWNPTDDVTSYLTEGNSLTFYNISASGYSRFGDIQLTSGKQTRYKLEKQGSCLRRATSLAEMQNSELKPQFSEVDVVGLVLHSDDSTLDQNSKLVYIADNNHNFVGISFWTELKATGYANTLAPGALVAFGNLNWRRHLVSWQLPTAYATEMSTVSQHPRQPHLQSALAELRQRIRNTDLPKYMESCQERIRSLVAQRNSGGTQAACSSGVKGQLKDMGDSGNCVHSVKNSVIGAVNSSLTENLNSPANRRLEMLERYGEPPPISPLPTSTPTSVKRSFRPPLRKLSGKR